jgi:hypothetical protein
LAFSRVVSPLHLEDKCDDGWRMQIAGSAGEGEKECCSGKMEGGLYVTRCDPPYAVYIDTAGNRICSTSLSYFTEEDDDPNRVCTRSRECPDGI